MTVELINSGTELLLGEVVNTHAAWIAKQVFPFGLRIARQTTVPDGPAIRDAVCETFNRADIVFVTGGLGPTTDDITREAIAEILGLKLVPNETIRSAIEARLAARGYKLLERMLRQTMVPEGAIVLSNKNGTAPGLYIPSMSTPSSASPHFFLLPGPPRELKPMFEESVLPILRSLLGDLPEKDCRIYRVVGLGESAVEEMIGLELSENKDLEVGYCARPNEVDFRLIGAKQLLDTLEPRILQKNLVSAKGEGIEEWITHRLATMGLTISTAESCTGGLLANRLTNVPGSSKVFHRGFVTYSNESKSDLLGVSQALLSKHGAVSEPVARAMAEGALHNANSDFSLALTGVAGPDGGTPEKPVGTVFIAMAQVGKPTHCQKFSFPVDRATFKQLATQASLDMLRRALLE
ncbi:MAG: competence/damage-inducible protein A [Verrucomicrobia bacterium]|nr:competence/damage-inducible protein A [Verrucomicrobiota bacterium]